METKKASKRAWKHVICCLVLLIIFVLTIGIHVNSKGYSDDMVAENSSDAVPLQSKLERLVAEIVYAKENEVELAGPKEEVKAENDIFDSYITTYANEIEFFAKLFGVNYEEVIEDLKKRAQNSEQEFENTNIGYLLNKKGNLKTFRTTEYGLVEYFYDYIESNPKKVNKKRIPYTGNAKYVENLIIYFTTHVYTNVDPVTALSIGAAESGYYKVKFMLKSNNVYGGMSSKGLIKYDNIEYGVMSYIRLLSKNYYSKGLDTTAKIGRKYCPTYDESGDKIASPHWMKLVRTASKKYNKYDLDIQISDLLNKEENA